MSKSESRIMAFQLSDDCDLTLGWATLKLRKVPFLLPAFARFPFFRRGCANASSSRNASHSACTCAALSWGLYALATSHISSQTLIPSPIMQSLISNIMNQINVLWNTSRKCQWCRIWHCAQFGICAKSRLDCMWKLRILRKAIS